MEDLLSTLFLPLTVLGAAIVMMVFEIRMPGRKWPKVTGWYARTILLNVFQAAVIVLAGLTWDGWLRANRPWNADALGPTLGGIVGYVATTFVYYWWHRWRHEVRPLWLWFHQVHHSPQRIEVITSFYKHPLELCANGVLSSVILYTVVGLGPQAAGYAMLLSGLAELFYHWNVRTPYWLGFLIQRPESHCVHHQEGLHAYNYGDLPLWDWMFGTLRNPKSFDTTCGFGDANEHRLAEMICGVDVITVPAKEKVRS